MKEIAHRTSDGIEVVLFWRRGDARLTVTVADERTGAYFELDVEAAQALDAFHHPYAYAAFRGLPYEDALLPSWAQAAAA
jgi:hypothetical protein